MQSRENDTFGHSLIGSCRCGTLHGSFGWPEQGSAPVRKPSYSAEPSDDSIIYEYKWGNGEPAIRVIRTPEKDFYQQHLDDSGSWVNGTGAIKPPLYRLPELLAADPERTVMLVEGEKDVDQATQVGLVATTNSRGAKGFQLHHVSWLAGRKVLIVADNDQAGVEGANRKAELLRPHVRSLKVVKCLPGLEDIEGGDLSDWLEANHSKTELKALLESLPEWRASSASVTTKLKLSKLSDFLVQPENEIAWLVDGWMPMAGTSAVVAKPKVGKSTFARNLSQPVARCRYRF
ncbi:MAG: AAA family ATPase [Chloroflexi bacterium]|nr:AAA family ATPase [Chloroflexota bacterium]